MTTTPASPQPVKSTRFFRFPTTFRGRAILFGPLALLIVVLVGFAVLVAHTRVPLPESLPQAQTTLVTMADGSPLGSLQGEQNRTSIPLSQVPPTARAAVLAAEDRSYYSESGVSIPGIIRAALYDLAHGRLGAGGSTITQQYVKNAYLNNRRSFSRKIREAVIAVKIDRRYPKDKVLEFYLNTIYFGRGAYGIEAASQTYFGIPASQLNPAQAAVLAASIQAPERLDPSLNPTAAAARWHYVIDGMVKIRALPADQAAGLAYPQVRARGSGGASGRGGLSGQTGYVLDMVRAELEAKKFSSRQIYGGGLRVRTTITPKAQAAAVQAVNSVLAKPEDPQSALVAIEPGTGKIEAVYGGKDYGTRQFNNATQALRQPGSSFKPYVLAAALDKGISLKSMLNGASPQSFPGYDKPVSNFSNEQFGNIDLVTATADSVNTIFVPLAQQAGLSNVVNAARSAGIPDGDPSNGVQSKVDLRVDASLALGTSEVHPIDQAAAFATFAAQGKAATPFLVDTVTTAGGSALYHSSVDARQKLAAPTMADLTFALEHVISGGTATPEAILAGGRPAAGKTGTTTDSKDAWFCGYTPSLAAAVWMGYDPKAPQDKTFLTSVEGVGSVTGGTLPARIWKRFMDAALAGTPNQAFPPPVFGGQPLNTTTTSSTSPTSSTSSTIPPPTFTIPPTLPIPGLNSPTTLEIPTFIPPPPPSPPPPRSTTTSSTSTTTAVPRP